MNKEMSKRDELARKYVGELNPDVVKLKLIPIDLEVERHFKAGFDRAIEEVLKVLVGCCEYDTLKFNKNFLEAAERIKSLRERII